MENVNETQNEMETAIQAYADNLNIMRRNRDENASLVTVNRGYKYTRLEANGQTLAFIGNDSGDIYKPASNAARASGVRGNINNEDPFEAFNEDYTGIQHRKRGPKPRNTDVEGSTETVGEVEVSNETTETASA